MWKWIVFVAMSIIFQGTEPLSRVELKMAKELAREKYRERRERVKYVPITTVIYTPLIRKQCKNNLKFSTKQKLTYRGFYYSKEIGILLCTIPKV